jgi:hypothetical protein
MVDYSGWDDGGRGRSIERISPEVCSRDKSGIWQRCSADKGSTAGEVNTATIYYYPIYGMVAEPNPFCSSIDGLLRIEASTRPGEGAFTVSIYDMKGIMVSRLISGAVEAGFVSCGWDGADGEGNPVPTGLYICVVEFMMQGGGVCRQEKCVVAVSEKGK